MSFSFLCAIFISFFHHTLKPSGMEIAFEDKVNLGSNYTSSCTLQFNNLNPEKIIYYTSLEEDTIYITGNMNIEDSLSLMNGFIVLDGDLTIQEKAVLNISSSAFLYVKKDINLNGTIYGSENLACKGEFYKYVGFQIFEKPKKEVN